MEMYSGIIAILKNNCNCVTVVTVHTSLSREVFWHEYAKIPRHTSQNSIAAGNLEWILAKLLWTEWTVTYCEISSYKYFPYYIWFWNLWKAKRIEIQKNKKNSKKLLTVYIVFGIVPIVATISKTYDRNRNAICGSVGTGRRARLRILWALRSCGFKSHLPHRKRFECYYMCI